MSQVFITCPTTGKPVYVGLNMEWNELESFNPGNQDLRLPNCRHCGQEHTYQKSDLFLRADGGG